MKSTKVTGITIGCFIEDAVNLDTGHPLIPFADDIVDASTTRAICAVQVHGLAVPAEQEGLCLFQSINLGVTGSAFTGHYTGARVSRAVRRAGLMTIVANRYGVVPLDDDCADVQTETGRAA